MKYALVALVLLAAFFIWRHKRRQRAREQEQAQAAAAAQAAQAAQRAREQALASPADMVRCRHCGLHLPLADATPGTLGHYCGHEHRQHAEG